MKFLISKLRLTVAKWRGACAKRLGGHPFVMGDLSLGFYLKAAFVSAVVVAAVIVGAGGSVVREDLGKVPINNPVRQELLIRNPGTDPIYLGGGESSDPSVSLSQVPGVVLPGSVERLVATFVPRDPGKFRVLVRVHRESWWRRDYRYELTGMVTSPVPLWKEEGGKKPDLAAVLESPAALLPLLAPIQNPKSKTQNKEESPVLIDVRSAEAFQQSHISGSLHVPLFALDVAVRGEKRRLVVVDSGAADRTVVEAVLRLRQAGHQATLLDGGPEAWRAVGGKLEGTLVGNGEEVSVIEPGQLFASADNRWMVVDVSGKRTEQASGLLGLDVGSSKFSDGTAFTNRLKKMSHGKSGAKLLLVTSLGEDYGAVAREISEQLPGVPVYFLAGGWEKYRQFLQSRTEGREYRKVTLAQQPTAITGGGIPIRRASGCSTCPH